MIVKGSCHCKATTFEVSDAPGTVTQCTCSFCSKRGALWAYYTPDQFKLTSAPQNVSFYRWGSKTIKHGFCAVCGCGTFTQTPDWSTGEPDFDNPKISVNARRRSFFPHIEKLAEAPGKSPVLAIWCSGFRRNSC